MPKEAPEFAITLADTQTALKNIKGHIALTPCLPSAGISELAKRNVFIKWESRQRTGSFKERGALNFLSSLGKESQGKMVCAASAGNHALALSFHAKRLGFPCTLVMPKNAPLVKVQTAESYGANAILFGNTFDEAKAHAAEIVKEHGYIMVPPFNHPWVIAGQGTIAHELLEQVPDFDSVIVPVGGGGLLSGIATVLRALKPEAYILGVQSDWALGKENIPHAVENEGEIIPPVTIADGIGVKTIGELTKPILNAKVDKLVSVSEKEIATSIIQFLEIERAVVEGAGAVGLAALLRGELPAKYTKPVIVVCGSNIDLNVLSRLIAREMTSRHQLLKAKLSVPDRPGTLKLIASVIAKSGGNILEVSHDRSFSDIPGNVEITVVVETRDSRHRGLVFKELQNLGVTVTEMN